MLAARKDLDEHTLTLDEFAAVWASYERLGARLALAVGRLDACDDYRVDGSLTMASWLRHHCRLSDADAGALVRRGRFLRRHDRVAGAALCSRLSAGQIAAIQTVVTAVTEPIFVEQEQSLVDHVAALDVRDTRVACRVWHERAEAIADIPEPEVPDRSLTYQRAGDGTLLGRFVFDPALGAEFDKALGTAITWDGGDDQRNHRVRQADALFDILAFFNLNHDHDGTPRHRPHVEIVLDADDLTRRRCCGATVDGDRVPSSAVDAYLCDSWLQPILMSGSVPLDVGRASRTVPLELFRAVAQRDGGCRHPGCRRKVAWCHAHHVTFWRHGGVTALDNLVLLCSRHHHLIHRPGWALKLKPDGDVEITNPHGNTYTGGPRQRNNQLRV